MRSGVMFLRAGCTMPDELNLSLEPFCEAWMSVGEAMSTALDVKVRDVGWHFIWVDNVYSCRGVGLTEASAVTKAIVRALGQVKSRFNAAELKSIKVSKCPGFWIANITLHVHQIQQHAYLSLIDEITIRQLALR